MVDSLATYQCFHWVLALPNCGNLWIHITHTTYPSYCHNGWIMHVSVAHTKRLLDLCWNEIVWKYGFCSSKFVRNSKSFSCPYGLAWVDEWQKVWHNALRWIRTSTHIRDLPQNKRKTGAMQANGGRHPSHINYHVLIIQT